MKVKNFVLLNLEGAPLTQAVPGLKDGEAAPEMTLVDVLTNAALLKTQQQYTNEENVKRWRFAKAICDVELGEYVTIPNDMLPSLQANICFAYPPIVVGQVLDYLENGGEEKASLAEADAEVRASERAERRGRDEERV